ncbi:MAG: hypothetical protein ABIP94_20115 [Planctomycetota bacterium]
MRRKTAKTLADLGRLIPLTVCLFAGSVAWIWAHHPSAVATFEVRLAHLLAGHLWGAWEAAKQATDPATQRVLLEGLEKDLGHVRSQDRMGYIVDDCQSRLIALAEARGDLADATKWARASVAFDDRNVLALVRLGRLLCAEPSTHQQGLDQLRTLSRKFTGDPHVTSAVASALARSGRGEEALAVLDAAFAVPQSNGWIVQWDAGEGLDGRQANLIPTVDEGHLRLRFDIADRCRLLRFLVPACSSFSLVRPTLYVVADGQTQAIDLLGAAMASNGMARNGDRLEAIGESGAWIDVVLPTLAVSHQEFTLTAGWQPRRSTVIAAPAVEAAMDMWRDQLVQRGDTEASEQLRLWRNAARVGLQVGLCCRAGDDPFDDAQRLTSFVESTPNGGNAVAFSIGQPATQLRIHLPASTIGLTYEWTKLVVVIDGRTIDLDPLTMVLLGSKDVERRDGAFVSTGVDPRFWFAIPAGRKVDRVYLEGRS